MTMTTPANPPDPMPSKPRPVVTCWPVGGLGRERLDKRTGFPHVSRRRLLPGSTLEPCAGPACGRMVWVPPYVDLGQYGVVCGSKCGVAWQATQVREKR